MLVTISCYLFCFSNIFGLVLSDDYCYMKDNDSYTNFGARTAYKHIHGKDVYIIPGCKIVYIWALMRHGTRYADSELHSKNMTAVRDQIIKNHEIHKRGKLCDDDLQRVKNWTDQWTDKISNELTYQGVNDLKGIGSRLKEKLGHHFDFLTTETQTTSIRRCQQSSITFTNELFNTSYADLVGNGIKINNALRVMEDKAPIDEEMKKFLASEHMKKVVKEVTSRLGYESEVSSELVINLYSYCSYENAWFVDSKPGFCAAFTPEHLKILEYREDLVRYYGYGYENQTARRLACPIVQDLFARLTHASNNAQNEPKNGVFYVTHTETLLPTYALLRLFETDPPLLPDNYELQSGRSFRTSFICPFAANLIAILYECPNGFKVVFYNNEKIIKFPGCNDKICSMEVFHKLLSSRIATDCSHNNSASKKHVFEFFVIWFMAIFVTYFVNKP